jgi:hypothetical protein
LRGSATGEGSIGHERSPAMTRARCWRSRPPPLKVITFRNAADAPTNISVESRYCTRGSLYKGPRKLPGLNGRAQLSVLFWLRTVVLPGAVWARRNPAAARGCPRPPRPTAAALQPCRDMPCAARLRSAAPAVFPSGARKYAQIRLRSHAPRRHRGEPSGPTRHNPAGPLASVVTADNLGSRNSLPELIRLPSRNCAHIATCRPAMDCRAIRHWLLGSSFSVLSRALRIGRARPPGPAAPARSARCRPAHAGRPAPRLPGARARQDHSCRTGP